MNKRLLGSLAALALPSGFPAQADTRLIVNSFWPSQLTVFGSILPNWLAEVERATEVHPTTQRRPATGATGLG